MKNPKKKAKIAGKSRILHFEDLFSNTYFAIGLLVSITFMVYSRSLLLGYTKLDDSIFIVENAQYNADLKNIDVSFHRGLFNPTRDAYYRPIFLVDFILESRLFGIEPAGYHVTNLLFHILSVILLFLFLKKIKIPPLDSFLLSLLFALHPVLTQAVAWIPGRNDMLLMIFFLSTFILMIKYLEKPNPLHRASKSTIFLFLYYLKITAFLFSQAFIFLVALFTKETAVIIPVIMGFYVIFYFIYEVFYLKCGKRNMVAFLIKIPVLFISWIAAIGIWLLVRSTATLSKDWISPVEMLHTGIGRMGVVLQYIGKIFFPVNLTVFPIAEDITLIWGILAVAVLIGLVIWSKSYTRLLTWLGLGWFIVFLVPVLIVPKSLNDQVFEHRLYLPMIGILIMLSQVVPFNGSVKPKLKMAIVGAIALIFAIQGIVRTGYFNDPLTFWTHAVDGSPHSAYARTLLATKVEDPADRERLFKEAHVLDPTLKNLNYYLGKVMFAKKELDSAEYYFRQEVAHNPIADAYFLLAQIAFEKKQLDSAAVNLEKTIGLDSSNSQASHNLALLYFQRGQVEKSTQLIQRMELLGMEVADLRKMIGNRPN